MGLDASGVKAHAVSRERRGAAEEDEVMPKMIGNSIEGAARIQDNAPAAGHERVRLSYSQAILLPAGDVVCSLDTTDKGSPGRKAKRWYRWYASAAAILASPRSTKIMRERASATYCQVHDADDVVPGRICGHPIPCPEHAASLAVAS
jgi:hypothetical protein